MLAQMKSEVNCLAQRRMFSLKIIDSDAFIDMPISARCLYYDLAMRADDDGFVSSPKKILRMTGASNDDLNVLILRKFIIPFESGICVVSHWRIHNYIQKDRYQPTLYQYEMKQLAIKDNGVYTKCAQNVYTLDAQIRLDEIRLDKNRLDKDRYTCEKILSEENISTTQPSVACKQKKKDYNTVLLKLKMRLE